MALSVRTWIWIARSTESITCFPPLSPLIFGRGQDANEDREEGVEVKREKVSEFTHGGLADPSVAEDVKVMGD